MLNAIVMINCAIDAIPEVAQTVADVPGVEEVYSVTGDIDLIALIKVEKYDDLAEVVTDRIAKISGLASSSTHVAFRTYSKTDLEQAFHLGLD